LPRNKNHMPYYRRRTVNRRRAPIRRRPLRKRLPKRKMRIMRNPVGTGVPESQFVKLKYTEVVGASNISMSAPAHHVIRMNSLYDPQASSDFASVTGHTNNGQPLYRDQWAAMYYGYRVYASKIKVTWTPYELDATNAGTNTSGLMVLYPSDSATTDGDIYITAQRTGAKKVQFGGAGFTAPKSVLSHYSKCHRPLGLTSRQYSMDPQSSGGLNSGSNPADQVYWNIAIQNTSTVAGLYGYLYVEVKYYVKIFNRVEEIAAS